MALREIDKYGRAHETEQLSHVHEFEELYYRLPAVQRNAIEAEINRRLDELVSSPDPHWGSITNTSLEGGQRNPLTGRPGDWSGTVFEPIYHACGQSEDQAAMLFGNIWKKVIIARTETWIGVRSDPTFPNRGITVMGKTYFLPR